MTPLIREFSTWCQKDPTIFTWFDVGQMPTETVQYSVDGEKLTHLPFKKTAIVGVDGRKRKFIIVCVSGLDSVATGGWVKTGHGYEEIAPFAYMNTPEGVRLLPAAEGGKTPDKVKVLGLLSIIAAFTESLSANVSAYQPSVKTNSPTNKRRIQQGQPPLVYDWHTVTVEPRDVPSQPLGGTHATPRRHQCRGHWRNCKSGKRVWVKDCWKGDASKGVVFKDYLVKGVNATHTHGESLL